MRTATYDEIRSGKTTDIYFQRTREILEKLDVHKRVTVDVQTSSLPHGYKWGVLTGIHDALGLLEGLDVEVEALEEGTVFGAWDPVLQITGDYVTFAVLETAILGYICQPSGIATKAARCKLKAGDRQVISFGARRMLPTLAPVIERNAYIGGCDGVSVVLAAELMGIEPSGTMPHALVLMLGNVVDAVKRFDEIIDPKVPRVALVDTLCDEKFESLAAAHALKEKLAGVRFDTPGSRRGNMARILDEVRWELNIRGFDHVKLIVSGGVDEEDIIQLNPHCDGYGVGTSISNADTIDFALDIVEIDGQPFAKRGKSSGKKQLLRCENCFDKVVVPYSYPESYLTCPCGGTRIELLKRAIRDGKTLVEEKPVGEVREKVFGEVEKIELSG